MDVSAIDYYANHGGSFLHKASAPSKLVFAGLVIASVVVTGNFYFLLGAYITLAALVFRTGLPAFKVITIAAYPAIFALIFAAAGWNGNWIGAGVIVLKALTAALASVIVIVTTPYPDVFASLRPFLPKIIAEGLFLTYRSLFLLLDLLDNLLKALQVRGGISRGKIVRNVVNFSSGIGLLLVRGLDISEKFYGVMRVRGYNGKLSDGYDRAGSPLCDAGAVLTGAVILALALMMRYEPGLESLGIYFVYAAVLALVLSAAWGLYPKREAEAWKKS
jgi:cobalt/nickel transport system permease protein